MDHVTRVNWYVYNVIVFYSLTLFIFEMYPRLFASCFVILFALSRATSAVTGSEDDDESSTDDIWALLVAGSTTWMNYRHQVRQ